MIEVSLLLLDFLIISGPYGCRAHKAEECFGELNSVC
jgi:hypothetical protein